MNAPKQTIEALLFSSGKAMDEDTLAQLAKLDKAKVKRALKALQQDYAERDGALAISNDDRGWKMGVRNEYLAIVKDIVADTELSTAVMETLAVIAYKYPKALQSEVVDSRGSGAYDHIAELEKLGFLRKEREGRSYALKLTEKFFNYFDVQGEADIKSIFKKIKKPEAQKRLGDLDVVEVVPEEAPQPLEGMDVVPVTEEPEPAAQETIAAPLKPEKDEEHLKFLADLDKRIDDLAKRHDEGDEKESS